MFCIVFCVPRDLVRNALEFPIFSNSFGPIPITRSIRCLTQIRGSLSHIFRIERVTILRFALCSNGETNVGLHLMQEWDQPARRRKSSFSCEPWKRRKKRWSNDNTLEFHSIPIQALLHYIHSTSTNYHYTNTIISQTVITLITAFSWYCKQGAIQQVFVNFDTNFNILFCSYEFLRDAF